MKETPIKSPTGAMTWSISSSENKVKLSAQDETGLGIREWPIDECTVETIRERWGTGTFQVHFFGKKGGVRTPKGSSTVFEIYAEPQKQAQVPEVIQQPAAIAAPMYPVMAPSPQDAFLQSLQVSSVMQDNAMKSFANMFEMVGKMVVGISSVKQGDEAAQANQHVMQMLQQQQAVNAAILARLEEIEGDEEDDEEDEEDEDGISIVKDGSLNTDAILNKGMQKIPDLIEGLGKWASANAEEKTRKNEAPQPIPNAHVGGTISTTAVRT